MRTERGAGLARAYADVAERGPLTASELTEPGQRSGKWWGWGDGKARLEYLYDSGLVAIAGRRRFERTYDLTERVIPRSALDQPAPPRDEAKKQLICLGAAAYGVGTRDDVVNYFNVDDWRDRLPPGPWWERNGEKRAKSTVKRLVAELVEEGRLLPAIVEGWSEPAFLAPGARVPVEIDARALVAPFDSLVWERDRIDRLFGMKYSIEIYTPEAKRIYGYYVFPFLLGDRLVGRCDLKADRRRRVLMVRTAHVEPGQNATRVARGLADELEMVRTWLDLDRIEVGRRGGLAASLRRAIR
jgi:uncharacterized protein YcaQ